MSIEVAFRFLSKQRIGNLYEYFKMIYVECLFDVRTRLKWITYNQD